MADPVNTIVDHIPLTNGSSFFDYFNDSLYCTGDVLRRVNLSTKQVTEIGPTGISTGAITAVDFHRPYPAPADDDIVIIGSGAPDGRVYVTTYSDDFVDAGGLLSYDDPEAAEIVPPLLDQFTHLADGRRALGGYQLDNWSMGMAISPDGKRLFVANVAVNSTGTRAYVSNSNANTVSVVDVTEEIAVIATISGFNNPSFLRLSADDRRLYVADWGPSPGIAVAAV